MHYVRGGLQGNHTALCQSLTDFGSYSVELADIAGFPGEGFPLAAGAFQVNLFVVVVKDAGDFAPVAPNEKLFLAPETHQRGGNRGLHAVFKGKGYILSKINAALYFSLADDGSRISKNAIEVGNGVYRDIQKSTTAHGRIGDAGGIADGVHMEGEACILGRADFTGLDPLLCPIGCITKKITSEVTRGIASGLSYAEIARNLQNASKAPLARANTIARTEGHRIQEAASFDAGKVAKSKGADIVKQWDSTLDGDTRETHRLLDGQIVELEEPFEVNGMSAMYPGDFGDPAEDCNCRCKVLKRAKWALDEDELQRMRERASFFGLLADDSKEFGHEKEMNFSYFKKNYLKAAEKESKILSQNFQVFDEGEKLNQFFYYDDYESAHGLMAKRNSAYGKWRSSLSEDSKDAIYSYTADGYGDVNSFLRKKDGWESINAEMVKEQISMIDKAIESFDLKSPIKVQRGAKESSLDVLFQNNDILELKDLIGKKYSDDAFMSSTALYGNPVATTKPVVFDIDIPAGKGRGAYINEFGSQFQDAEYEFLIKRSATFTITDISEDVDLGKIYVKMVMDVE